MKQFQAGKYINQGYYRSFQPNLIYRNWRLDDMEVIRLLSQANRELGRLDMYSNYIPNIDLFISMHVVKEATQSSKIEGTKTQIDEALLAKEDLPADKRNDWEEVQNYIQAMNEAIKQLEKLPFSSRMLKETHRILLQGVRGEKKQPGEFRRSQNWIGGNALKQAHFIPPVHTSIPELMSDLEKFLHYENQFPEVLKIALAHYQFETIHPFLDGNGRIGRLMIPLYLVSIGLLQRPILYLSDYFERNRSNYYAKLDEVREKDTIAGWLIFFLQGLIETATNGIATFEAIMQVQTRVQEKIQKMGRRAGNAHKVVNTLYQKPVTDAEKVGNIAGVSPPSAYQLLAELERFGILKEISGSKRRKQYIFEEYIKLFKS